MKSLQTRLNIVHNDLVQLLTTGKRESYANLDRVDFEPGTIEKMNRLLAQRNLILDMIEEERKNP